MIVTAGKTSVSVYYYIVQNRRRGGRVVQRVCEYLGRDPEPKRLRRACEYWGVKSMPGGTRKAKKKAKQGGAK